MLHLITKFIILLIIDIALDNALKYRDVNLFWRIVIALITNYLILILINIDPQS